MYVFNVEEAQKDLPKILEMVAQGKDVAIGGDHPVVLHRVRALGNLGDDPETCGSIVVGYVDDSVLDDEAVKPLPDYIIDEFYKPLPDDILAALKGR
ncbi:hypothetical protein QCE47_22295 [Caballeronia sp. LZ025]|uniref:hypothetical protein n=1 Tax=Caballeronia TaxID=1827195 RepID=UPI001FD5755D|nr:MULTISPECIES: hypothetical protein [Caballeronia]MDR5735051.1 hypothetical protein [Caballeronia sp. LZ025]